MTIATTLYGALGTPPDIAIEAYDDSAAGPTTAPVHLTLTSPKALSYLLSAPGELGLARAYITGELQLDGDMFDTLKRLGAIKIRAPRLTQRLRMLRQLGGFRMLARPPIPATEIRLSGRRHSKRRDQAAIAHHYDVSNAFYELILGSAMTYTCAVYPTVDTTLEKAQYTKHDLVARKLDLQPGMRLLDVGCGWGGMVLHAAREYGVKALGVTLSQRQAEWAQAAIAHAGLSHLAEVRHMDYRDVPEEQFDAVSSIGLTEHIGERELPNYFSRLLDKLRTGGRLLNHCITRPNNKARARAGRFIDRYVFPDGELVGPGHLVSVMHDTGFEVRHEENLREHYALTLADWSTNLEREWSAATNEVGVERARVWRLYLAASRLGFERNNIQLHQVLASKTDKDGESHMPLRPTW